MRSSPTSSKIQHLKSLLLRDQCTKQNPKQTALQWCSSSNLAPPSCTEGNRNVAPGGATELGRVSSGKTYKRFWSLSSKRTVSTLLGGWVSYALDSWSSAGKSHRSLHKNTRKAKYLQCSKRAVQAEAKNCPAGKYPIPHPRLCWGLPSTQSHSPALAFEPTHSFSRTKHDR